MSCPNTNLEEWKLLVAARGEDVAYALWDLYKGNVPESESKSEIVKSGLKATNILQSPKADQFFNAVAKNKISGDFFWRKMQADLGIPKDQIEILKSFNTQDKGELISSLLANYSYTVEINTAKENLKPIIKQEYITKEIFESINVEPEFDGDPESYSYIKETPEAIYYATFNSEGEEYYTKSIKGEQNNNSKYYSNLTVPGGINYTENEISTPAITPSIKGHSAFSTDSGIGWFRSDDKQNYKEQDIDTLINNMKNSGILKINCS